MKRLIKWFFLLVLLLVVAVIAIPFFIPLDNVKKIASEKVKTITGRELVIAGDVKASFWPNIGVTLNNVTLSNPEGYDSKNIVEIGNLTAEVALMPLLSGDVKISRFIINKPIINLEINKNGTANWQFTKTENNEKISQPSADAANSKVNPHAFPILGDIKIIDGSFNYKDLRSKNIYITNNVNIDIKMPSNDAPLDVSLSMIWNKEKINLVFNLEEPLQIIAGKDSKIKTDIKIGTLTSLMFNGKASMHGANGNVDIKIPSLITLAKFTGTKLDWKGDTALAFDGKGALNCNLKECALGNAKLTFDDSVFNGDMKVNFADATPLLEAKLSTDKFDLNHYLPKAEKQAAIELISSAQAAQGWDTKKIDLSGLRAINAGLVLNIGSLLYKTTNLSTVTLNIQLKNGALSLDIPNAGLYNGVAKISATATANNVFSFNLDASNIQIEPLLKDFAEFDRLTGIATISGAVTASGASQQSIISTLSGKGNVKINDGTIRGIDIGKVVSNAKAMVTGVDTSSEKTKFSELSGTYLINQGIVKNEDLIMKAPLLRLKGAGIVDLPNKYVNYRLVPSVVATMQGQGGKDKTGLDIPIIVEGDFEKLKFTPDLGGIAQDALKNPEKIKDTVKTIKDSVGKPEDIKNLLKGFR